MRASHSRTLFGPVLAFLLVPLLLGGCGGGSVPIRYYLIEPITAETLEDGSGRDLAVGIIDLQIPQYLDRFQIASRRGGNRLSFSQSHQWGESLRENLLRTLARNLSALMDTAAVNTPLNRFSIEADYRLLLQIERFERDRDGRVRLDALWQVSRPSTPGQVSTHRASLVADATVAAGDYDAMVSQMRILFGDLSRLIAEFMLAEQSGGGG